MAALNVTQLKQDAKSAPVAAVQSHGSPERDREIAQSMMSAVRALNDALDAAIKAGLVVEPSFATATNRFDDLGITAQSFVATVRVFRKLC